MIQSLHWLGETSHIGRDTHRLYLHKHTQQSPKDKMQQTQTQQQPNCTDTAHTLVPRLPAMLHPLQPVLVWEMRRAARVWGRWVGNRGSWMKAVQRQRELEASNVPQCKVMRPAGRVKFDHQRWLYILGLYEASIVYSLVRPKPDFTPGFYRDWSQFKIIFRFYQQTPPAIVVGICGRRKNSAPAPAPVISRRMLQPAAPRFSPNTPKVKFVGLTIKS